METKKHSKFDIDIEIKDLLWEFARRWRVIVVMVLICGIGLAAYQYRIDMNKTDVVTVKKTQEELEKAMGEQDLDEVSGAVALKKQLDQKSLYMDTSELMQINPYAEDVVLLQYYVSAENEVDAKAVTDAYISYVDNDYLAQAVVEMGASELETMYVSELISLASDTDGLYINTSNVSQSINMQVKEANSNYIVSVKVLGKTAEDAKRLADSVKTALQSYTSKLTSAMGAQELVLLEECSSIIVDQNLAELQNRNATAIKTLTNNLDSMKNEMTSDQIALYVYRTTVVTESEKTTTTSTTVTTAAPVRISVKHAVIGMVVGAILACGIIFVCYIFSATLRSKEEIKTLYNTKVWGFTNIVVDRLFSSVDSFIIRLRNGRNVQLTVEQQIQMICANIVLDCKKNGRQQVYVSSSAWEAISSVMIDMIGEKCAQKGIQVVKGEAIIYNAEALEEVAQIGSVVFIETTHVSYYDEIYKEMLLCKEHDIDVIGMIVLGA